jgi:hypothetical protein
MRHFRRSRFGAKSRFFRTPAANFSYPARGRFRLPRMTALGNKGFLGIVPGDLCRLFRVAVNEAKKPREKSRRGNSARGENGVEQHLSHAWATLAWE